MDEIIINNLKAFGILGVNDYERHNPREIKVDLSLFTDTKPAAVSDAIDFCIDYGVMSRKVVSLIEASSRFTVEALAEDIANLCLSHPLVKMVKVYVEKPGALPGGASVGVQITRKQSGA